MAVSIFVAVTFALGTTAPVASTTLPTIRPVASCATAEVNRHNETSSAPRALRICVSPFERRPNLRGWTSALVNDSGYHGKAIQVNAFSRSLQIAGCPAVTLIDYAGPRKIPVPTHPRVFTCLVFP